MYSFRDRKKKGKNIDKNKNIVTKKVPHSSPSDMKKYDDDLKFFITLNEVLGEHYLNSVDRLQLKFIPPCIQNIQHCSDNHTKHWLHPEFASIDMINVAMNFCKEERYFHFLKCINDMCIQDRFPREKLLSEILRMILTVYVSTNDTFSSADVIQECVMQFNQILLKFPPCWFALQTPYTNLFKDPFEFDSTLANNIKPGNDGIFVTIITMLENLVKLEEEEIQNNDVLSQESEDDFLAFQEKDGNMKKFDLRSRSEKFDRLFISLDLLVKLMESDLSIWILRHRTNISKTMFNEIQQPLIAKILYWKDIYAMMNNTINNILKLFVDCSYLKYPSTAINVLARLISLIANAGNLCKFNENTHKVVYPVIESTTTDIVKALTKIIRDHNVECYADVIQNIECNYIKMLLIDNYFNKLNKHTGAVSVEKILENFQRKRWLECAENPNKSTCLPVSIRDRYPVLTKKNAGSRGKDVYADEYLNLLLEMIKSYLNIYQFPKVVMEYKKKLSPPTTCDNEINDIKDGIIYDKKVFVFNQIKIDTNLVMYYRTQMNCLLKLYIFLNNSNDIRLNAWIKFLEDHFMLYKELC